jgi:hypothetical protein
MRTNLVSIQFHCNLNWLVIQSISFYRELEDKVCCVQYRWGEHTSIDFATDFKPTNCNKLSHFWKPVGEPSTFKYHKHRNIKLKREKK